MSRPASKNVSMMIYIYYYQIEANKRFLTIRNGKRLVLSKIISKCIKALELLHILQSVKLQKFAFYSSSYSLLHEVLLKRLFSRMNRMQIAYINRNVIVL